MIHGLRLRLRSDSRPETSLAKLAVASASPSIAPSAVAGRPEREGDERRQQRVINLARQVHQQADEAQDPDIAGEGRRGLHIAPLAACRRAQAARAPAILHSANIC